MKFVLNRSSLKQAVSGLSRVVAQRVTLPVLGHVRFDLSSDSLIVTGTDLEQLVSYQFGECHVDGTGCVLLPLQNLKELAKGRDGQGYRSGCGMNGLHVAECD